MCLTYSHIQITAIPQLLDEEFKINMAEADRQIALAMSAPDLLAERDRLREVNVELLVALKGVIRHIGPFMGQGRMDSEIAVARAAITKAEGVGK